MTNDITRLKIILGINDNTQDKLLRVLRENALNLVATYINATVSNFPLDLNWIVDEITVKRFNRISNEGMVNETLAQRNVTFESDALKEYKEYIRLWVLNNPEYQTGKKLKML